MRNLKKKFKIYYILLKNRYFNWQGFCTIFIIIILQLLSNSTILILNNFLMESYCIAKDSYILYIASIICRLIFFIIQMIILYEFTQKKAKLNLNKHMKFNTALFYLNDSNKDKVSKTE